MLFDRREQDEGKVNQDVIKAIKEIRGRNKAAALMDQFKKMDLLKDSGSKDKSQNSYQELKRAMST